MKKRTVIATVTSLALSLLACSDDVNSQPAFKGYAYPRDGYIHMTYIQLVNAFNANAQARELPVRLTETETPGVYLVNVYAQDENGKPHVAYRAVYDENTGKVSHQVDKNGKEVPYMSDEFYEKHKDQVTQKDAERGVFTLDGKRID